MKRKQIIIILCVALAVCTAAITTQAFSAKTEKPTKANLITTVYEQSTAAEAETLNQAEAEAEGSTKEESSSKAESTTAAGQSTTAQQQTTAKETTTQKPAETTTEKETETKPAEISITLSITCKNAVQYGNTSVPQNGVILSSKTYTAEEGATVFDALKALCEKNGIALKYDKPYYIQGIGGLNEKDCGAGSGWMYRVNGATPMKAANKYILADGDEVEWYYVTNSKDN